MNLEKYLHDPMPEIRAQMLAEGYRVLKRLKSIDEIVPRSASAINITFADTETTGLNLPPSGQDQVVELGLLSVDFDPETMNPIGVTARLSQLEESSVPMSEEALRVTGIDPSELAGQRFNDDEVLSILGSTDLMVAHNASFDARGLFTRWPSLNGDLPVMDSLKVDWRGIGSHSSALGAIAAFLDIHYSGHRAIVDAEALFMVCQLCKVNGRTVVDQLYRDSFEELTRIMIVDTPFAAKDEIKEVRVDGSKYEFSDGEGHLEKGWHILLPSANQAAIDEQIALASRLRGKANLSTETSSTRYALKAPARASTSGQMPAPRPR